MVNPKVILPESLRAKLSSLGAKLEQQAKITNEFDGVLGEISNLSPSVVVKADREIAHSANLQKWRRHYPRVIKLFSPKFTDIEQLGLLPDLAYLFVFHRDGYIREAALKRISSPLPSAFLFAAVAWRLNDWVLPVRKAAAECALRCFPITSPSIIAEAASTLLARENSWGRWAHERSALASAFARDDVAEALAQLILTRRTGPMATVLRYALRDRSLDRHLERLAVDAVQPTVRATAFQALVDGCATWPSGWEWHWINKPMGIRRRRATYSERPLEYSAKRLPLIKRGAGDSSAIVRRAAASSLIRYGIGSEEERKIAAQLLTDKAPSVRERAEFYFKQFAP